MYALESILPIFLSGHEHGHSHQLPPPSTVIENKHVEMSPATEITNGTAVLQETSVMLEHQRPHHNGALTPMAIMVIIG